MMTTPAQPPKVYAALDPPPQDARFGDLLQLLLDKGVRAPRSGKVGRPWQFEEFAGHVPPLTSRQLRNIRNHRSLPHDRHFRLMLEVLFGTDPSDYAEWRADLSNALHRGRAGRKLARKRSTINVPAQATNIASQSFVPPGTTPARVPLHFHAREDDLAELHRNLIKPPHRLALHGAHGVGKTVVAAAYAERHRHEYRATAWINAETEHGCLAGLIAFGQRMGWTNPAVADDANLLETLQRLASEGGDCLIIFDNATSPSAVHRFVPNGNTHILFTSNSPNWRASAKTQAIDSWSSEVGARYLVRRLGRDTSITAARRLTGDLGGLPLALELAASYCERRGVTIVEYRQRLATDPSQHLLAGDHTVPGYPHTVAAAYALSMAAASAEHHAALPVLQLLSFLAPSAIPTRLLDDARTTIGEYLGADIDGHATEAAIAALHNHSLLSRTMIDTAPLGDPYKVVLVHRLIGLVSRANTSAVHDACEAIARALILALPEKQHHAHRELGYRELIARHVEHMLEAEGAVRLSRDTVATLHGRYALIKVVTGGAPIALQHARKSLRLNEECHGRQSLPFAMALYVLGVVLLAIRKPRSARIVHCEALAITTRHRDEFHPDAAEIRAAIAETFIFEEDLVAAESLLKEITVARMRYWPADDPESADMLLRLCSTQIQMGRYADALPSIAEASLMLAASVPPDDDRLIDLRVHVVPTTGQSAGQDASIVGELRAWVVKLAKSREDQPEHVAAALMHIGIAAASRYDPSGWLLLDDALRRMSDPSLNRCWGLLQRSRLQPEAEHAIQDARASLSEAERLDDATAIESAARTLHHLLKAESRQDEADVVRNTHLA